MQKSSFYYVCRRYALLVWDMFSKTSDIQNQMRKLKLSRDIVQVKVILCLRFNSKAVETWSILDFFFSPFGNHGDSTVSYKQSLWEGITLEILLKNNLNLVLTPESWGGAFCQHSLLFRTRNASICVVTGPATLLGNSIVTVEFF